MLQSEYKREQGTSSIFNSAQPRTKRVTTSNRLQNTMLQYENSAKQRNEIKPLGQRTQIKYSETNHSSKHSKSFNRSKQQSVNRNFEQDVKIAQVGNITFHNTRTTNQNAVRMVKSFKISQKMNAASNPLRKSLNK